jgi:hypothetical protein
MSAEDLILIACENRNVLSPVTIGKSLVEMAGINLKVSMRFRVAASAVG